MVERLIDAHKFRCFICGHVFMGEVHVSDEKES